VTEVVSGIRPRPITDPYINSTHNKGDLCRHLIVAYRPDPAQSLGIGIGVAVITVHER